MGTVVVRLVFQEDLTYTVEMTMADGSQKTGQGLSPQHGGGRVDRRANALGTEEMKCGLGDRCSTRGPDGRLAPHPPSIGSPKRRPACQLGSRTGGAGSLIMKRPPAGEQSISKPPATGVNANPGGQQASEGGTVRGAALA